MRSPPLIISAQLANSIVDNIEYGAILGANGNVSSGIFTSNDPGRVDPTLGIDFTSGEPHVKGTNILPSHSMHTHLAKGTYSVPGTKNGTFTADNPAVPGPDDTQLAKQTVPAFILVPSLKTVLKIERSGDWRVLLSAEDYDQWMKRAQKARVQAAAAAKSEQGKKP